MRLASQDELHRTVRIGQHSHQAFGIVQQQVGSLIGRESTREAEGQRLGSNRCRAASTSSEIPPAAQLPRAAVGAHYSTKAAGIRARHLPKLASSTLRERIPDRRQHRPRQRSLPAGLGPESSAAGESQLGVCTPLVT